MVVERRLAGRTLRAQSAQRHASRARAALGAFEQAIAAGAALAPGMQVRFGWSLLRLDDDGDALRAREPDFLAWPHERWAATIDVTLDVIAAQVAVLHASGADGEDACFDQLLVAAPRAVDGADVFLHRTESLTDDDSGWLAGPLEDPEALTRAHDLERVPIASLVGRRPALLAALALPRGFVAIVSGDSIRQVIDGAGRPLL